MNENKNRATFQSRLGFILVSAGCAIGLGNVWKFPYICGQNGGGAFLFLYLICLVLLGLPILICEFAIGRGSNRSLSQAFNRLESIEKVTKFMMILLMALMVVLAVNSIRLKGASEGLKFFLVPDFDVFKEKGFTSVLFAAMTQAFFTLSIGIGTMEIFGSYLKKDRTLVGESVNVIVLDTAVAVVAGLIIIPACFAYGIEPDSGPSLLFITLPNVFHHMASSRLWGIFFFIFMSFAALSTVIAVFENIITMSVELWDWSRKKSLIVNLVMILVLTMPAVFGFNLLKNIQPMGAGSTIMDLEDFLVSSNLLPLGSLVGVLFCVRKNGWGWENFIKEANTGKGKHIPDGLRSYMAYVVPALICFIYLKGYYDTFSNRSLPVLIGWMCFAVILLALIFWAAFSKSKKNLENPIDK